LETAKDKNANLQEVPQPIVEVRELVSIVFFADASTRYVDNKRDKEADQEAGDLVGEKQQHEQEVLKLTPKDFSSVEVGDCGCED
jgi:hypothetical protein